VKLFDWLKKRFSRKEEVGGERYVLKRQGPGGGMQKVMTLMEPVSPDDIYKHLEPGVYCLDVYRKGQSGFERVWGPIKVLGEEDVKKAEKGGGGRPVTAGFSLLGVLQEIKRLREDAKEEYEALKEIFEGKQITVDDLIDALGRLKNQYNKLDQLFGTRTSGVEPVKYKGELPVWMHPKALPELIDSSLERIERRLIKWGVIPREGAQEVEGPLMKFPERPRPKKEEGFEISVEEVEEEKNEDEQGE